MMETAMHLKKVKEFIENHEEELNTEKLIEYGSTALLALSALKNRKLIQGVIFGLVVATAGKLAYDYLLEKIEEAEAKA